MPEVAVAVAVAVAFASMLFAFSSFRWIERTFLGTVTAGHLHLIDSVDTLHLAEWCLLAVVDDRVQPRPADLLSLLDAPLLELQPGHDVGAFDCRRCRRHHGLVEKAA